MVTEITPLLDSLPTTWTTCKMVFVSMVSTDFIVSLCLLVALKQAADWNGPGRKRRDVNPEQ